MCGIIGVNENNPVLVEKAAKLFRYRGPDAFGAYSDQRITLGHNRLAIIDVDSRSNQPMRDESRDLSVVFNGEIYNFMELRDRLSGKYHFRTASDTEVLLYSYKEWGAKMTEFIQGMFAFAIYDRRAGKVFLARDHRGIKPLYYYADNGLFVFASEIKGVIKVLKEKNVNLPLNKKAVDLYTVFGCVPSPYSLYEGIFKLPRSSYLEYDLVESKIIRQENYIPFYQEITDRSKERYAKLIEKKVLDHLVADVPVGVFFSGGTDSSLIAAILHKQGIDLETFSIKVDYKSDDAKYFKKISEHLNIKSNVFNFDITEFDEVYHEVMDKIDEPICDNSIFPTYFVSKKAAQKVKVVLSGEGGDEFFYGYPRSLILKKMTGKEDYRISWLDCIFLLTPSFKAKNLIFEKLFVLFKKPVSFYLTHMSTLRDRTGLKLWMMAKKEFRERRLKVMEFDQEFYLENDLLRKTDWATSYVSIEGRVPLLDIDIIKNSENFEERKLEGGVLKSFLKKILTGYLPPEMVYRNKSGFGLNIAALFRESKHLKADLIRAVDYLKEKKIMSIRKRDLDVLITRYPHYCFALIALHKTIINNERI